MLYIVGHKNPDTDSICSSIVLSHFLDAIPARLGDLNPESEFILKRFGVMEPELITSAEGKELILVDHSEKSQSLEDLDKGRIIGIIDHHKVGITTSEPIIYIAKPLGSTATIVGELYFKGMMEFIGGKNRELKEDLAGLLLSAIISDTVLFKSPTTTNTDRDIAERLAKIAGIEDINAYGMEILKAKSTVGSMKPEEIVNLDYKEFNFNGKKIGIGQVEVIDVDEIESKKEEIYSILEEKINEGYDLILFLITDIMKEGSEILVVGNREAFERAFNVELKGKSIFLEGVMSRKKQVVPPLGEYYKNNKK